MSDQIEERVDNLGGEITDLKIEMAKIDAKLCSIDSKISSEAKSLEKSIFNNRRGIDDNRDEIRRIRENDIAHLEYQQQIHHKPRGWKDKAKDIGAIAGLSTSILLVLTNLGKISEYIFNFLKFFFG